MKNIRFLVLVGFILCGLSLPLLAATTIGGAAQNLLTPTEILKKLMVLACYVGGVGICLSAMVQYNIHRKNPKLVPLTTPVMLLIIGIVLIVLPYFSTVFDDDKDKEQKVPVEKPSGLVLPPLKGEVRPKAREPQSSVPQKTQPLPPPPSGGGHWSDDPKYQ